MSFTFENKVALVTGGSLGIGAAVALQLAEGGARVLVTGRHEATLQRAASRHPRIEYVVADITRVADIARSLETVRSRFDRLDVLVNNAGVAPIAPLGAATPEHVQRTLDVNVLGLVETTRQALPLLKKSRGAIVNVATVIADQPFANMSVYCASKAAVLALTRAWAQELAPDGIRVNAVSPGPIETSLFTPDKLGISAAELEQMGAAILQQIPVRRFGKPEEVASVITFLASAAAAYVTGAQYAVGGGMEA